MLSWDPVGLPDFPPYIHPENPEILIGLPDCPPEIYPGNPEILIGIPDCPPEIYPGNPFPSGPVEEARDNLVANLKGRLDDLSSQYTALKQDAEDPTKRAAAMARIELLSHQMAGLEHELGVAFNFKPPANLSRRDEAAIADLFGQMNDLIPDLADPSKNAAAQARLAMLGDLLNNPGLYEPSHVDYALPEFGNPLPSVGHFTQDPVIINHGLAVENLQNRLQNVLGQMDAFIGDPSEEAQARLQMLTQQSGELQMVVSRLMDYQRPANLPDDLLQGQADCLVQIDEAARDLGDPMKHDEALARLSFLFEQLTPPEFPVPYFPEPEVPITYYPEPEFPISGPFFPEPEPKPENPEFPGEPMMHTKALPEGGGQDKPIRFGDPQVSTRFGIEN